MDGVASVASVRPGARRICLPVILALGWCVLLQAGCFSLMVSGGLNGSRDPSAPVKAAALAADVVTLPVQLGAVGVWNGIDAMKSSAPGPSPTKSTSAPVPSPAPAPAAVKPPPAAEPVKRATPATPAPRPVADIIVSNPAYIFDHNLDLTHDQSAIWAVNRALRSGAARFTDDQLRRLYVMLAPDNAAVLANPNCSEAFLRETFAALPRDMDRYDSVRLTAIVQNPAVPTDLLEAVAADKPQYELWAVFAKLQLDRRAKAAKE
jgi:hypothetical protein